MSHPLFDLSGRVAVVSGAASGMGKAMSLGFAESGADLVLLDINLEGAEDTAQAISKLGRKAIALKCDVSDAGQVRAAYSRTDSEFGRVDIAGNVAGEGHTGRPEEIELAVVEKVFKNLVIGRFAACQEAGRRMLAQKRGSIINLGSIGGVNSLGRGHTPYGMAMGAVIQMTRELSTEWSGRGVRVNCIVPAQVMNKGLEARMQARPDLTTTFLGGIPMGRFGKPNDIKGLAIFLASDASSWVTGAVIPLDGGNLALNAGGSYPGGPRVYG
ncbi:MAG: SDR family oxidoreductase [SAR202 cluster bacterium]|nr:SDR family oxidoreductase [SAR202 cluster bacterium]